MVTILLIVLAAAVGYVASVYVFPFRQCGRCGGSGSTRRRFDLCKRCTGTGRVHRPGARQVHRAVLSARSELARERQRRRDRTADERTRSLRRPGPRTR